MHSRRAGDSKLVLLGGNAFKKCDIEFNVKILRMSPAPNHCCHIAAVQVTMSGPDLRLCIVDRSNLNILFEFKSPANPILFNQHTLQSAHRCWCLVLLRRWPNTFPATKTSWKNSSSSCPKNVSNEAGLLGFRLCLWAIIAANVLHCRRWGFWKSSARWKCCLGIWWLKLSKSFLGRVRPKT